MLLNSIEISLTQEANTAIGSDDGYEYLDVILETQVPGDDPFIIIKTDQWSIDEPPDLSTVIEKLVAFAKTI